MNLLLISFGYILKSIYPPLPSLVQRKIHESFLFDIEKASF